MTQASYSAEWAAAVVRTKRFGLDVRAHNVQPAHRYLNADRQAEFPYVVQRGLGDLDFRDVVAQCLSIHYRLMPIVEEWLGCPVLYTLGWVDDGTDRGMFRFDDAFISEKLKNGHRGSTVNVHAWLTLPSMEIIDVALATTIAVLQRLPAGYGAALARHADELDGIAYKPMLVGPDFLHRTGLLVEWGTYAFG